MTEANPYRSPACETFAGQRHGFRTRAKRTVAIVLIVFAVLTVPAAIVPFIPNFPGQADASYARTAATWPVASMGARLVDVLARPQNLAAAISAGG